MTALFSGFADIFNLQTLLVMSLAIAGGIVVGTLPGLSSVMAISLMLPVAYGFGPVVGLSMLGAIYTAALYGGANSAILLNTPGTPSSLPTAFDGFPLTRKGLADRALYGALFASVAGGLFGTFVLVAAFEPLANLSLKFGPPEFFALACLGLCAVAAISEGQALRGLLSACLGLMLAMVGQDPVSGAARFTFGIYPLVSGIEIIPALLGLFSLSQAIRILEMKGSHIAPYRSEKGAISFVSRKLRQAWSTLLRSSFVGSIVGILPGAGGAIASIIAYNEARRVSKTPEQFGKGAIEGIFASESANNAQVSSSLVPMMGLGIPGNVNAAVIMGALMSFGIQPGMGLLTNSGDIAYAFMASLIVANLLLLAIGLYMVKLTARVLLIPNAYLGPCVIALCIVGAYAASYDIYGVWVMFGVGLLGYVMLRLSIPIGPMALGMVLGPIAEKGLGQSLQMAQSEASLMSFISGRPIALLLFALCLFTLCAAMYVERKTRQAEAFARQASKEEES